jgi:RHS repeat-associated protein
MYEIYFRIVFKVGNPIDGPQEHMHYNYDSTWKDQLVSITNIDYVNGVAQTPQVVQQYASYDNSGNPTKIENFKYEDVTYHHARLEYDGRQLVGIKVYNDDLETIVLVTISYKYNDQGIRTEKTVNGIKTEYFVDGDKVLQEKSSDGTVIYYLYDEDGKLIGFNYNNKNYLYIRNSQDDITKIVDESGNIVVEYTYDAWGNILNKDELESNTIAKINPYRYRGYRYDEETDWYYLNSRYYNPEIGRFINADGLVGQPGDILGYNMYAYSKSNPIRQHYFSTLNNDIVIDATYYEYSSPSYQVNNSNSSLPVMHNSKFELFTPIHLQANYMPSNYGTGGARALFFDLTGPTFDNNGVTLFDASVGLVRFDDEYDTFGWGVSLFEANAFLGATVDKWGFDLSASVFKVNGYIPINNSIKVGGGVSFLSVGYALKYKDGRFVVKYGFGIIGLELILDFE